MIAFRRKFYIMIYSFWRVIKSYPSYRKFKQINDNLIIEERKTEYKESKDRSLNFVKSNHEIRYLPLKWGPRTKTNFLSKQIDNKL